jgi:DNA-binding PadR family transcriptional regulator
MSIPRELEDRFLWLVDAWETALHHGKQVAFMASQTFGSDPGARLIHPGLPRQRSDEGWDVQRPFSDAELHELQEAGLIRVRDTGRGRFQFDITSGGVSAARVARLRAEEPSHAAGGLRWENDLLPVLEAVYRAATKGNPFGVEQKQVIAELGRPDDDPRTDRLLYELERTGYIEATMATDGQWGPLICRLTEKGYQQVAGWPGRVDDSTFALLIRALDERIECAETEEERSKWVRLRDAALGVGRDLFVDVMGKVLTSQV